MGFGADGTRQPRICLFRFVGCLPLQASSSLIQFWPCLAEVALAPPTGSSATISDGSAAYADARCRRSFYYGTRTAVPTLTPMPAGGLGEEISRVQTCCAPGPTYILKVGDMPGPG